jgi:hypothetical protein
MPVTRRTRATAAAAPATPRVATPRMATPRIATPRQPSSPPRVAPGKSEQPALPTSPTQSRDVPAVPGSPRGEVLPGGVVDNEKGNWNSMEFCDDFKSFVCCNTCSSPASFPEQNGAFEPSARWPCCLVSPFVLH